MPRTLIEGAAGAQALEDRVYAELVRVLYASLVQAVYMAAIFAAYILLLSHAMQSVAILVFGSAAIIAWTVRMGLAWRWRRTALTATLDRATARRLELGFALPYGIFALFLGLIGGEVFLHGPPEAQTLSICVQVGFCAGVATGLGARPRIATCCMVAAMAPSLAVAATHGDALHFGLVAIATAYVVGGAQSLHMRHDMIKTEISNRLISLSLARRDNLTALPNRLALREFYEANSRLMSPHGLLAVHYLDLDGFKPVNDDFGHAMGDRLLEQVGDRLRGAIRSGDIVARLGGDEFAVLQFGLSRVEEAELLAERLKSAIAEPFDLSSHFVTISTCVGTVVSADRSDALDTLLQAADARLYMAKNARKAPRTPRRVA